MGDQRRSITVFWVVIIICITFTVITLNPRIKKIDVEIQYRNFQISTEAQYETQKEKVTDDSINDLTH